MIFLFVLLLINLAFGFYALATYMICRFYSVKIESIVFGIGIKVFECKNRNMNFCIKLIPIGITTKPKMSLEGIGITSAQAKNFDKDSLDSKTPLQKIIINLFGIFTCLAFSFCTLLYFNYQDYTYSKTNPQSNNASEVLTLSDIPKNALLDTYSLAELSVINLKNILQGSFSNILQLVSRPSNFRESSNPFYEMKNTFLTVSQHFDSVVFVYMLLLIIFWLIFSPYTLAVIFLEVYALIFKNSLSLESKKNILSTSFLMVMICIFMVFFSILSVLF